jgi:PilZ domain
VVEAMQSTSQVLRSEIPEMVRAAVNADLREFPRYDVALKARLGYHDRAVDVLVLDISEGGARIDATAGLSVGEQLALTFPGMKAIGAAIRAMVLECVSSVCACAWKSCAIW